MKMKKLFLMVIVFLAIYGFSSVGLTAPEDVIKDLHQAAQAEGKLTWQYLGAADTVKPVADAFNVRFPDVKLTVFSVAGTVIATRIITEATAKRLTMDVASSYPNYFVPLMERKLLMKADWAKLGVAKDRVLLEGTSVWFGDAPWVWFYNKNLVSKADVPKSWDDLLDPKWKGGKISVRAAPSAFTSLYPEWKNNKQKVANYFEKLKQQQVVGGNRATEVASRVATGEALLGCAVTEVVLPMIQDNAPIAVAPISPTAGPPIVIGIPVDAPHPNAAKLFVAWLNTADGKAAVKKAGLGLASPCDASVGAKLLCDNGIKYIPITSNKDLSELDDAFTKMVLDKMGFLPN
jgi:iron(III) transport system substrate-binding protein